MPHESDLELGPEMQAAESRLVTAFVRADQSSGHPVALEAELATLGEPIPAPVPLPNRRHRQVWLAAAAAVIVAVAGLAIWRDDSSTTETSPAIDQPSPDLPDTALTVEDVDDSTLPTVPSETSTPPSTDASTEPIDQTPPDPDEIETPETTTPDPTISQPTSQPTGAIPDQPLDDPNPRADGGGPGRQPSSSAPVPDGYPDPTTTGFAAAGLVADQLTPSPSLVIDEPGVYERLDIDGPVEIRSSDVTLRHSRITTTALYAVRVEPGLTNVVIEDTRVRSAGETASAAVYLQSPAILRRVDISGGRDNLRAEGGLVLEDSYLANPFDRSTGSSYNIRIQQGADITIVGNTIIAPWQAASGGTVAIQARNGPIATAMLAENYLSGGSYTVQLTAPDFAATGVSVRDNRVELDSWSRGWLDNRVEANVSGTIQLPS